VRRLTPARKRDEIQKLAQGRAVGGESTEHGAKHDVLNRQKETKYYTRAQKIRSQPETTKTVNLHKGTISGAPQSHVKNLAGADALAS